MPDFDHLITTQPHEVRQVLISDLHLSMDEPALVQAFLMLIDDCIALPKLERLFILGDWFEVWLGDDAYLSLNALEKKAHWLTPLIKKLTALKQNGCDILVMHGNRDFLLGQKFCDLFDGTLIFEPFTITINDQTFILEHGDALCTDDKKYQWFRKIIRNPLTQWYLLKKPLKKRLTIADNLRQKSQQDNAVKANYIMDVNENAVAKSLQGAKALIHGHTHRPQQHQINEHQSRFVLGDWRLIDGESRKPKVKAVIGVVITENNIETDSTENFRLVKFCARV
ncbi:MULTISPECIES: UDP-2,3-diacylglucosamine diphosphatase [Psychrobacter]|uniref:UDP-2,3-diacylglucosamine diphosphatase n=1 Tax=Psychrobacter TaxID=497 RepID=UPI001469B39A|nr:MULTISPECIES: UDP-2,3-diacylglucosamine diphosphatase [Psychrobacter]